MLREHVLKDFAMIDMTAKHLLKLVNEEKFVTDQINDIMILLLKEGIDFNKETRGLTEWAVINWMKTIGKDQLSYLIVHQVLRDKIFILPATKDLLYNYLEDDIENLENLMAGQFINVGKNPIV